MRAHSYIVEEQGRLNNYFRPSSRLNSFDIHF